MLYVDASALVKLLTTEAESAAVEQYFERNSRLTSSALVVTELGRVARRYRPTDRQQLAAVLDRVSLIEIDAAILEAAILVEPISIRSLDAIHLASALALGSDLEALITYDTRMADAARSAGLRVESPA